jgi:hypothetical protein
MNLYTHSITAFKWSPFLVDYSLGADLWFHLIMVRWIGGARLHIAYHRHSTTSCVASTMMSWVTSILAQGGVKKVRAYKEIPSDDDSHKVRWSMNGWQECVRNHPHSVDLWKLSISAWEKNLGKTDFAFYIMRWCLSRPGSPKYILTVTECIIIMPVTPYV